MLAWILCFVIIIGICWIFSFNPLGFLPPGVLVILLIGFCFVLVGICVGIGFRLAGV